MIVGLINTTDTTFCVRFSLLLNSHFNTGIRDNRGTPDPLLLFSVRSMPPSTIISSFFARIIELNFDVDVGEGLLSEGVPIKWLFVNFGESMLINYTL